MSTKVATITATRCRVCIRSLPARAATGRPAVHCSEECRRLAELEIRRVGRRLEKLEATASDARIDMALYPTKFHATKLEAIESETDRLTTRMRVLIEGDR
jgi:hypothetical protein